MTPDGEDYVIEVVEKDALTGKRKDQLIAQGIINFDNMSRDENFKRAWSQFVNQAQSPQQQAHYGNMYGNPYMPPYGGGFGGWGRR